MEAFDLDTFDPKHWEIDSNFNRLQDAHRNLVQYMQKQGYHVTRLSRELAYNLHKISLTDRIERAYYLVMSWNIMTNPDSHQAEEYYFSSFIFHEEKVAEKVQTGEKSSRDNPDVIPPQPQTTKLETPVVMVIPTDEIRCTTTPNTATPFSYPPTPQPQINNIDTSSQINITETKSQDIIPETRIITRPTKFVKDPGKLSRGSLDTQHSWQLACRRQHPMVMRDHWSDGRERAGLHRHEQLGARNENRSRQDESRIIPNQSGCEESWSRRIGRRPKFLDDRGQRRNNRERGLAWCRRIAWSCGVVQDSGRTEWWPNRIGYGPKLSRIERGPARMRPDFVPRNQGGRREKSSHRLGYEPKFSQFEHGPERIWTDLSRRLKRGRSESWSRRFGRWPEIMLVEIRRVAKKIRVENPSGKDGNYGFCEVNFFEKVVCAWISNRTDGEGVNKSFLGLPNEEDVFGNFFDNKWVSKLIIQDLLFMGCMFHFVIGLTKYFVGLELGVMSTTKPSFRTFLWLIAWIYFWRFGREFRDLHLEDKVVVRMGQLLRPLVVNGLGWSARTRLLED